MDDAENMEGWPDTAVQAGVTDGNTPSERLLTGLGFVRTGQV
ncbi:hypothetical protein [Kutzneria sp. 744]|nr:hypothetical protein [Kutzneria sp. 744]